MNERNQETVISDEMTSEKAARGERPPVAAVIVAGGRGTRFAAPEPKQFLALAGKPVLTHTVRAFLGHGAVEKVVLVLPEADIERDLGLAPPEAATLLRVEGGETRQASVRAGLEALAAEGWADRPQALVLVHDGARPLVSPALIDRLIEALDPWESGGRTGEALGPLGALPACPVHETVKRADTTGLVLETVPREGLYLAQTPQGAPFETLLAAHRAFAEQSMTDDVALLEAAGHPVRLVAGDPDNLKITTPPDLARAEGLLKGRQAMESNTDYRVGIGYDVHRLGPGDGVWLGGLKIPCDRMLLGHSDADVLLHALTDALLGAVGEGDIGQHFPPSDPQWKGAASDQFVEAALGAVAARGGRLINADLLVICERPKVGPHRGAIRTRVAGLLGVEETRVNIKATTSEGLGFTGREEGIAAQAAVSIALPA